MKAKRFAKLVGVRFAVEAGVLVSGVRASSLNVDPFERVWLPVRLFAEPT